MPEGFVLDGEYEVPEVCSLLQTYINGDMRIEYEQDVVEYTGNWGVTSDGTKSKEIMVGNEKAALFTDEGGYHNIILVKDGYVWFI